MTVGRRAGLKPPTGKIPRAQVPWKLVNGEIEARNLGDSRHHTQLGWVTQFVIPRPNGTEVQPRSVVTICQQPDHDTITLAVCDIAPRTNAEGKNAFYYSQFGERAATGQEVARYIMPTAQECEAVPEIGALIIKAATRRANELALSDE